MTPEELARLILAPMIEAAERVHMPFGVAKRMSVPAVTAKIAAALRASEAAVESLTAKVRDKQDGLNMYEERCQKFEARLKLFDALLSAKWLDPECGFGGCQSLVLKQQVEAARAEATNAERERLDNIRMCVRRARAFGSGATPQTEGRILAFHAEMLGHIERFCVEGGASEPSILRSSSPTPPTSLAQIEPPCPDCVIQPTPPPYPNRDPEWLKRMAEEEGRGTVSVGPTSPPTEEPVNDK